MYNTCNFLLVASELPTRRDRPSLPLASDRVPTPNDERSNKIRREALRRLLDHPMAADQTPDQQ